jgi:hypothetical protein
MPFNSRQINELQPLAEVSFCTATPGAVGNNTTVGVTVSATLGAAGSGFPATFGLGDWIQVYPSAGAATNGISVTAAPNATAGSVTLYFQNNSGASVTPVAGATYKLIAYRQSNSLVS